MLGEEKHSTLFQALKERRKRIRSKIIPEHLKVSGNFLLDDALSAKYVFSASQKIKIILVCLVALILALAVPYRAFDVFCAVLAAFYIAVVFFRAAVLIDFDRAPFQSTYAQQEITSINERYAVFATLYKEANQVDDLVKALTNLKWPVAKLKIYLICEAHDTNTINAIKQIDLPEHIQLIECPKGYPQTKPRALNYVLQFCEADYLAIYDAEDRPHPDQLIEAHVKFTQLDDDVVCLQAPLVVDNANRSFFTRMFAIEYLTLFYGILVSLSNWKAPMPLGGTSNHFNGLR